MVLMKRKVALKCVSMKCGAQCVTISGAQPMHRLYATSWDLVEKVRSFFTYSL